jgi:hypothetical protein
MQVINQDQYAFLPFRYILNILPTHETITWAKKFKQPLIFFKLDFSKASNRINQRFLLDYMSKLGILMEFT